MINIEGTLRVELSKERTENAFLVALIPALPIPTEFTVNREITNCSVIAANHGEGNDIFSYVHLHAEEKQFIGDCLSDACVPLNEWVWCNLYVLEKGK